MANRRYIDFPIASTSGDTDIILIWQDGANKQTTKATFLSGLPENLDELNDVAIAGLTNGQILRYDSVTGKWENTDQGNLDLNDLNDVSIVSPSNGQVLVYNSSTNKWENSSAGFVPYTGAVTTVNLGAQTIQAGSFVKAGGTAAQFLKANGSVDSNVYGTGTVTSVALTMPTAFSVANSPITTAGTLAVTGAGTVGQYIRGDGSLADFPESSGGGSSISYYLNGSVSQGTIGGVAYKEINKVPILGAGTDFTINADGYIMSFITDAGDPNLIEIPGGNWNFETYFSASSSGGSPTFYVELYKVSAGGTATLIASNSAFPELIAFGTNIISYFSTLAVPTTALALTDRLAIRYYVTHSGRTITLHTENGHLCQIITTFTTGITALNGLTAQVQNFAVGTSGTDFAIASATATHTFNLPTASATNRGALSSADWTTFNGKTSNLGTVTSVGLSSATSGVTIGSTPVTTSGTITLAIATASGSQNGLLSSTDWTTFNGKQNALTNPVTGTGTSGQVAYFTGTTAISSESNLFWDSTNDRLGIKTNTPTATLDVKGVFATTSSMQIDHGGPSIGNFIQSFGSIGYDRLSILGSDILFLGTGTSESMRITTNKNLHIGTFISDNGARLQVNGPATISSSVTAVNAVLGNISENTNSIQINGLNNTFTHIGTGFGATFINNNSFFNGSAYVFDDNTKPHSQITLSAGVVALSTGSANVDPTAKVYVLNNGNVGIGTLSPSQLLELNGTSNLRFAMGAGHPYIQTNAQDLNFGTRTADLMVIKLGGNVGISTTNPKSLLQVGSVDANSNGELVLGKRVGAANRKFKIGLDAGFNLSFGDFGNNISDTYSPFFSIGFSSGVITINNLGTGTVSATAGVLSTISDSRYKTNDGFINSAIDKVLNLKPRYFYWNEKSGLPKEVRQLGFYAQEVNEALGEEAANKPKNENSSWGISDRSILAMLTKAIQELKEEIDTLKK